MKTLQDQSAVVVDGSRGLGLCIVEALVANNAKVTVVARNAERLPEVELRFGVSTVTGDATDRTLARTALQNARPAVLAVLAGGDARHGVVTRANRDVARTRPVRRPWNAATLP